MKFVKLILINAVYLSIWFGLIINNNYNNTIKPLTYKTFKAIPIYSFKDSPKTAIIEPYIEFNLKISRNIYKFDGKIELIIITDLNIID